MFENYVVEDYLQKISLEDGVVQYYQPKSQKLKSFTVEDIMSLEDDDNHF